METKKERPTAGYNGLIFALSLVVAFLGANPFADAVGFPREDDHRSGIPLMMRIVCGVIVFFATTSLLGFLVGHVRAVVGRLGATGAKPDRGLALACLICGTVCLLAALFVQIYASTHPSGVRMGPTMSFNAGGPGGSFNMEAHAEGSIGLNLISVLTFLAGAGLIAFGGWGSLKPTPTPPALPGHVTKSEGWDDATIDEART